VKATVQIFISYVQEDKEKVENLYQKLSDAGFKPWMDTKDVLPGELWKPSTYKAIQHSDFFLVCLSANSVNKRGVIQKEIRHALDIWQEMLEDDIYLIPVRLEDCEVPERLREFQWVNLFEEDGWIRLVEAIHVGIERRGMGRRTEGIKPPVQESPLFESYPTHEGLSSGAKMATPEEGPKRVLRMMPPANPYSPGKPIEDDRGFIGRKDVVKNIKRYLEKNVSCAIIGGVGMGKTSVLKYIEREYSEKANADQSKLHFIPIYFAPGLSDSLRGTYQRLIYKTISQTRGWLRNCVGGGSEEVFNRRLNPLLCLEGSGRTTNDFRALQTDLIRIIEAIQYATDNTKLLFLFDRIFRIEDKDCRIAFVKHWFELLELEDVGPHLAIVICSRDVWEVRSADYLPAPIGLCVFKQNDSCQVMNLPLKDTLNLELTNEVADKIHNFTGGYPLLLQSAMSDLWDNAREGKPINIACVQNYFDEWTYTTDFCERICRWVDEMISEDQTLNDVFKQLRTGEIRTREDLAPEGSHVNKGRLRVALKKLQCWGVVCEMEKHVYRISGELFREWFFEPRSAAPIDETNWRSQIDELEGKMTRKIDRLDQYRHIRGVVRIQERLKKTDLPLLRTIQIELIALEKNFPHPGDPIRDNKFHTLAMRVQSIELSFVGMCRQLRELGIQTDDIGDNLAA